MTREQTQPTVTVERPELERALASAEKYIRRCARWVAGRALEAEDVAQELRAHVWQSLCAASYDPTRLEPNRFAIMVVCRRARSVLRTALRSCRFSSEVPVSLDAPHGDRNTVTLHDVIGRADISPEVELQVISNEWLERAALTRLEAATFRAIWAAGGHARKAIEGESLYSEVARQYGVSVKAVDNALQRARRKLATVVGLDQPELVPGGLPVMLGWSRGRRCVAGMRAWLLAWSDRHAGMYVARDAAGRKMLVRPERVVRSYPGDGGKSGILITPRMRGGTIREGRAMKPDDLQRWSNGGADTAMRSLRQEAS